MRTSTSLALALVAGPLLATTPLPPETLREVLDTGNPARAQAVAAGLDHLAVPPDLSSQLHAAIVRTAHPPGPATLTVPLGDGVDRLVVVRIPAGYDPAKAWPLLLAYHWSGGSGGEAIAAAERQLGARADEWVIAAPHHYRQTGLDAPPPFRDEHAQVLRALRRMFHLDAERTVVTGWSLGGYTSWMWALLHNQELAAAVAIAATSSTPPGEDGLWEAVAPNAAALPVLTVWGARDGLEVTGLPEFGLAGRVAGLNRQLAKDHETNHPTWPWRFLEVPNRGHEILVVDDAVWQAFVVSKRAPQPDRVSRRFRHLHQGDLGWVVATALAPATWGEKIPKHERTKGLSRAQAAGRAVLAALPKIEAVRAWSDPTHQHVTITTELVTKLSVRLPCVNFGGPRRLTITLNGAVAWDEEVRPSLATALLEARASGDLDRLWCARVDLGG